MLDKWLELTALGYDVIPCGGSSKNPGEHVSDWQTRSWNEHSIRTYFEVHPTDGIAIRINGLIVDIEYDSGDCEMEVHDMCGVDADKTPSWFSTRGIHRLWRVSEAQRQRMFAAGVGNRAKVGELEIHLGLKSPCICVLPPTGNRRWYVEPDTTICALPERVVDAVCATVEPKTEFEQYEGPLRPGDELAMKMSWAEILEPHGWTRAAGTVEGKELWRRPGKSEGHSATIGHYHDELTGEPKLHVFTDNAPPFMQNKSYDKFMAWTMLNHNGDFRKAASAAIDKLNVNFDGSEFGAPDPTQPAVQEERPVIEQRKYPELDDRCYDFVLGEYVKNLAPYTEASPEAMLFQMMEFAGVLAGHRTYYLHGDYRFYLNGGCIVIGESGVARKGTGLYYAKLPIQDADFGFQLEQVVQECTPSSGEALIQTIHSTEGRKLLITCEEFSNVLRVARRESNTLADKIRLALDSKALGINRCKDPVPLFNDGHCGMIGHCTRDEFIDLISITDIRNGFLNRFNYSIAKQNRKIAFPEAVPGHILAPPRDTLLAIVERDMNTMEPLVLRMSSDARSLWEEYYLRTGDHNEELRSSLGARASTHVFRAAARVAVIEKTTEITRKQLEIAILMQEYSANCIDFVFGEYINQDADYVIEFIRAVNGAGATWNDIYNWANRHSVSKNRVRRVVEGLVCTGQLKLKNTKPSKDSKGGRPKQVFTVA